METDIFAAIRGATIHIRNKPTEDGMEHRADIAGIEKMLRANPKLVHAREEFTESTPLHAAAEAYLPRTATVLLKYGANVNAVAQGVPVLFRAISNDRPALHVACGSRNPAILDHGADINAVHDGRTALDTANQAKNREISDLLIRPGPSTPRTSKRAEPRNGKTSEMTQGAQVTIHEAIESGNLREVRRILAADPSQLHARSLDWTPLHVAVYGNRKAIAEALLDAGADINAAGPTGNTPLHFAAGSEARCRPAMAALLIRRGADVDRLNGMRESPLYRAVGADNWEHAGAAKVVRLLVQNGAIVDLRSVILWGKTKRAQELLRSGQVSRTELQEALIDACCRSGWVEGAGLLLDAGADVNAPGPGNRLALNEALGYLSEIAVRPFVEFLLQRGANPNIKDYLNQTALELAEKHLKHGVHRDGKIVKLLKQHAAKKSRSEKAP